MEPDQTINWAAVLTTSIPAFFLFLTKLIAMIERERMRKRGIHVPIPPESPAGPAVMLVLIFFGLLLSNFVGVRSMITRRFMKQLPSNMAACNPPCPSGQTCSGSTCTATANPHKIKLKVVKGFPEPLQVEAASTLAWTDGRNPFDRKPETIP